MEQDFNLKFKKIIKKAISFGFEVLNEDKFTISKYGGKPSLQSIQQWPKNDEGEYMSFIGQMNFEEMSSFAKVSDIPELPKKGILLFFLDEEKLISQKSHFYQVIYFNEAISSADFKIPEQTLKVKPTKLVPKIVDSLPMWLQPSDFKFLNIEESDLSKAEYQKYYDNNFQGDSVHQLLGYPLFIQDDPVWDVIPNMPKFTTYKGEEFEKIKKESLEVFEKESKNWVLLWEISSNADVFGTYFGDNGNIYLMIEVECLLKADFSNVKVTFDC